MAYPAHEPRIKWDSPGPWQGVTIERCIAGEWYGWKLPHNGLATQAVAAELLGVSLMSINNWVRGGQIRHIKVPGQPSAIPLKEVKRIRRERARARR